MIRQTTNQRSVSARDVFKDRGANLITPYFEGFDKKGNFRIEYSSGRGMRENTIYGVTVIEILPAGDSKKRIDLGKVCQSLDEAKDYVKTL